MIQLLQWLTAPHGDHPPAKTLSIALIAAMRWTPLKNYYPIRLEIVQIAVIRGREGKVKVQ